MWHAVCSTAEPPSFINTLPSVTKIAESQTAVLVCHVFGAPKPVITWKKDESDVIIGGRFRKENNGNLHIVVSNCYLSSSSFDIFLAFHVHSMFFQRIYLFISSNAIPALAFGSSYNADSLVE